MKNFCDVLIKIGSKYGPISVKEHNILPSRQTIARRIDERAPKAKQKVLQQLKQINESQAPNSSVHIQHDMWTDDCHKNAYSGTTAQYVDNNWELKNVVLDFQNFDDAMKIISKKEENDSGTIFLLTKCFLLLFNTFVPNYIFLIVIEHTRH